MSYAEPTRWEKARAALIIAAGASVMCGAVVSIVSMGDKQRKKMEGWDYGRVG